MADRIRIGEVGLSVPYRSFGYPDSARSSLEERRAAELERLARLRSPEGKPYYAQFRGFWSPNAQVQVAALLEERRPELVCEVGSGAAVSMMNCALRTQGRRPPAAFLGTNVGTDGPKVVEQFAGATLRGKLDEVIDQVGGVECYRQVMADGGGADFSFELRDASADELVQAIDRGEVAPPDLLILGGDTLGWMAVPEDFLELALRVKPGGTVLVPRYSFFFDGGEPKERVEPRKAAYEYVLKRGLRDLGFQREEVGDALFYVWRRPEGEPTP